jgi:hypothetical protein
LWESPAGGDWLRRLVISLGLGKALSQQLLGLNKRLKNLEDMQADLTLQQPVATQQQVKEALSTQTDGPVTIDWVCSAFLPALYWQQ